MFWKGWRDKRRMTKTIESWRDTLPGDWNREQREAFLGTVLKKVNLARSANGLEQLKYLPGGYKGEQHECPLARALNFDFNVGSVSITSRNHTPQLELAAAAAGGDILPAGHGAAAWSIPDEFREFVRLFDEGQFPEFENGEYDDDLFENE